MANNLKKIRMAQGISQTDLAKKIDMSSGYISDLENGRRNIERIQAATINKLCAALNCTQDELMSAPDFEFDNAGRLIVDGLYFDARTPHRMLVVISSTIYSAPSDYTLNGKVSASKLKKVPSNITISDNYMIEGAEYEYALRGLIPRDGYNLNVGRAMTAAELEDIKGRYQIKAISDEFEATKGAIYGSDVALKYKAVQITTVANDVAVEMEKEITSKGIEVANVRPNKISIRIK